jgi:signal transduction histidine kinase
MLLDICRRQWNALRRTDHFRREGVSNLSHDLRSPLTATVACLETLDGRWAGEPARAEDRRLVEIALRNTRNAAGMVQSLGDLAKLDEPEFGLRTEAVDAGELLDDIAVRFAERAARQGVRCARRRLRAKAAGRAPSSTSSCSSARSPTSSTTRSSSARPAAQ